MIYTSVGLGTNSYKSAQREQGDHHKYPSFKSGLQGLSTFQQVSPDCLSCTDPCE